MPALKLEIGAQYGKWTVLERAGKQGFNAMWRCRCVCGLVRDIRANEIANDKATKCVRMHGHKINLPDDRPVQFLWDKYKSNAKQRGYVFELGIDTFDKLTKGNCFYCGIEPMQSIRVMGTGNPYRYNGIDRKDNTLGYIESNCVPCCMVCNRAKNTMSCAAFFEWIDRISVHRNSHS